MITAVTPPPAAPSLEAATLKRRLIPVASHIIATEELPEDLVRSLIPKGRVVSDTKRVLCYYRQSPDNKRVIFGDVTHKHVAELKDLNCREFFMLGVLAIATLYMGLYPKPFTDVMHASVVNLLTHVAQSKL